MAAAIHLYLDENLSPKIANQLRLRGIDAISVRDIGFLGDDDHNHLARATQQDNDNDGVGTAVQEVMKSHIAIRKFCDPTLGDFNT